MFCFQVNMLHNFYQVVCLVEVFVVCTSVLLFIELLKLDKFKEMVKWPVTLM